jgi:asparagine synthase (glutamine-hydrolysing)
MLPKVDMMSMANGLEVRPPFLDHNIIDFAFSLPDKYKITKTISKRILQDTYRHILPEELYNRPKHGFEVPLTNWLRIIINKNDIKDLLSKDFINSQNIFNYEYIRLLIKSLFSTNPGNTAYIIWALLVFQYWWIKTYH